MLRGAQRKGISNNKEECCSILQKIQNQENHSLVGQIENSRDDDADFKSKNPIKK